MKSILKKTMAYFLTFAILITLVPISAFAEGETADLEISTLADLEVFRDSVNGGETYEGKYIKLAADIDLSEKYGKDKINWTPIGDYNSGKSFNGSFEGNGHKITGLYIKGEADNQGLFGAVYTGI